MAGTKVYVVTGDFEPGKLYFKSIKGLIKVMGKLVDKHWSTNVFVYRFSVLNEEKIEYNGCTVEKVKLDSLEGTSVILSKVFSGCGLGDIKLNLSYNTEVLKKLL